MPATTPCTPCCSTTQTTDIPGSAGGNAYGEILSDFVVPAANANVVVSLSDTAWMVVGQPVVAPGPFTFQVVSINSAVSATLEWLDAELDGATGSTVSAGGLITPSGSPQPALTTTALAALNATLLAAITAMTDNSGGTASDTIAAGVGMSTVAIPLSSLATGLSTSALDLTTTYTPGYAFRLVAIDWVTTIAGTGAGATQTFNLEIGTTNVTGGVVNPTLASTATVGSITAGSAITANNTGSASDTISLEMAAGGTVFTAGAGFFLLRIQNLDTRNAFASLIEKLNDLRSELIT